jgi:hypothetical protein
MTEIPFIPDYYSDVNLSHSSPSQVNMPNDVWLHNYIYKDAAWRNNLIVSPVAKAGNAVEDGLNFYIRKGQDLPAAIKHAIKYLKELSFLYSDNSNWKIIFDKCLDDIPQCVTNAVTALKQTNFFIDELDSTTQDYCYHTLPGIEIMTEGRTDLLTKKYVVELKTKWRKLTGKNLKDGSPGWARNSIPKSAPTNEHLRQCAFYAKATNREVICIYAAGFDDESYKVFTKTNCKKLTPLYLDLYVEQIRVIQQVRQNLLQISNNPKVLAKYIPPDFSHYRWNNLTEDELEEASELWK